ncbi:Tryptophan 5-hydroxylase 2 [Schistosoma japonicum]|nr:Tryptophan 5-hydroxylase 2 [Schistosoma japonicum]
MHNLEIITVGIGDLTSIICPSFVSPKQQYEIETLMNESCYHFCSAQTNQSLQEITFIISLVNNMNDMKSLINIFTDRGINIRHIESRIKKSNVEKDIKSLQFQPLELLIYVKFPFREYEKLSEELKSFSSYHIVHISHSVKSKNLTFKGGVPWFPRHISDLDEVSHHVLMYGKELDADHPGFKDEEYRRRRMMFADIAFNYKWGQQIPFIDYTETEKMTWGCVYRELTRLYKTTACREFQKNLALLQDEAGYNEFDLPQLQVVSDFLKARTGFCLRPVAGYLSARDFLSGLAFRVFYCTQYIRHQGDPFYTPEPDCCHELLGHVPMLADPKFARFSQEIGLASLGTSDDEIKKLSTCYFFTIEFGLCRQENQLRAYGAGLLSSVAELQYALSDKAVIKPFIPMEVINEECLVTTFQNEFVRTIRRPFDVRYNPYTQSIEIIESPGSVANLIQDLQFELTTINESLLKMSKEVTNQEFTTEEFVAENQSDDLT